MTEKISLDNPDLYINRELSLLAFHSRVLDCALDKNIPLLERLRFLSISHQNLDEFFEIRVAGLKQKVNFSPTETSIDGLNPHQTLSAIHRVAHQLSQKLYETFNTILLPALKKEGIVFIEAAEWNDAQCHWAHLYFKREILPLLTPVALDPMHPFPRLVNKSLNFIVALEGKDAFGRDTGLAVIHTSRQLPRVIALPEECTTQPNSFIFLHTLIQRYANELFPGMSIQGCYQFRLTRNSDLFVDEEQTDDMLHAVKGELLSRRYGDAVRLQVSMDCPHAITNFLLQEFDLTQDDLYAVDGPINLNRLLILYNTVKRPDLYFPKFTANNDWLVQSKTDIFSMIKKKALLLHHPFESFNVISHFIEQAANDPDVLAIKQTLYRTDLHSDMVGSLIDAVRAGKEVTAVIELRARFDEADNITIANRLQKAGALVVYGVVGYKTHAKMTLVIRKEGKKFQRYVHLGTGNYHSATATQYTDYSLLTAERNIGLDTHYLFQQLTGMGRASKMKQLFHAPFTLHKKLLHLIEQETEHAQKGKPAVIMAKMNALTEPKIIKALYQASMAGVKIDLIVRGICALRPGLPVISENIRVRSVVGRFLEHARVYYFHNLGDEKVYCASADWMERNLFKRVEVCFPIDDPALIARIKKEALLNYLSDNTQSWRLQKDGQYKQQTPGQNKARNAQQTLLEQWCLDRNS